jgi:hypothetical protein
MTHVCITGCKLETVLRRQGAHIRRQLFTFWDELVITLSTILSYKEIHYFGPWSYVVVRLTFFPRTYFAPPPPSFFILDPPMGINVESNEICPYSLCINIRSGKLYTLYQGTEALETKSHS